MASIAFREGCEAWDDGSDILGNPYPTNSREWKLWRDGWNLMNEENFPTDSD